MPSQNEVYTSPELATNELELSEFKKAIDAVAHKDYQKALLYFCRLDSVTAANNRYANLYTSYHGYILVVMGDSSGLNLCRYASSREKKNGDVFYNLAASEIILNHRRKAFVAISKGLSYEPLNKKLINLYQMINKRSGLELPFLSRENWLNKLACLSILRFIS